jgi:hypothetical protein
VESDSFLRIGQAVEALDKVILKSSTMDDETKSHYRALRTYVRESRDLQVKTGMDLYKAITQYGLYADGDKFEILLNDTSPKLDDKHRYTGLCWVQCSDKYVQGLSMSFVPGYGLGNVFAGANPRWLNAFLCGTVSQVVRKR